MHFHHSTLRHIMLLYFFTIIAEKLIRLSVLHLLWRTEVVPFFLALCRLSPHVLDFYVQLKEHFLTNRIQLLAV